MQLNIIQSLTSNSEQIDKETYNHAKKHEKKNENFYFFIRRKIKILFKLHE